MEIYQNCLLKDYSTFKIGGPAEYLVEIKSIEDAVAALSFAKKNNIKWTTIGKGSNCLFPDSGLKGLVIVNAINDFAQDHQLFRVGAGFSFAYLGIKTAGLGFSGLEFASGIPGSVGGAVYMNAGASGKEVFDCIEQVTYLNEQQEILNLSKQDISHSYRTTAFQKSKGIILEATFSLIKSENSKRIQKDLLNNRIKSQPYQDPSIGCFFKNPSVEKKAGQLIDQCGLKALKIGGAEVSALHANFIVNRNQATAQDVLLLKRAIQEKVFDKTGVMLEEEVQIFYDSSI